MPTSTIPQQLPSLMLFSKYALNDSRRGNCLMRGLIFCSLSVQIWASKYLPKPVASEYKYNALLNICTIIFWQFHLTLVTRSWNIYWCSTHAHQFLTEFNWSHLDLMPSFSSRWVPRMLFSWINIRNMKNWIRIMLRKTLQLSHIVEVTGQ